MGTNKCNYIRQSKVIAAHFVRKHGVVPFCVSDNCLGVGIDQNLVMIEAKTYY